MKPHIYRRGFWRCAGNRDKRGPTGIGMTPSTAYHSFMKLKRGYRA